MPVKFSLPLKLSLPGEPKTSYLITPDHLHAFFLSLLPQELAESFHKPAKYRPFCVWAPQIFKFNLSKEKKDTLPKEISITISFLKDEIFPPFLSSLFNFFQKKGTEKLFLGAYRVKLYSNSEPPLLKHDEYLDYNNPEVRPKPLFSFRFLTPISFKKGDVDYPLPDPKIVFKSLLNKWNYFSPIKISYDLGPALEEKLYIVHTSIKTYKIELSLGSAITGFVGKVIYGGKKLTEEEVKWLTILGNFANFAGIGRKTTMGLGMAKFESIDEPQREG
ncbi:MAG: CRISPR system precrRNA processing endoribonuclease RAMP protein Cas6 [Caldimicrobium sp.]